jgi:predicted nuclease with TOPRIM domain
VYATLLSQIAPGKCDKTPLDEPSSMRRAERLLEQAGRLGCAKYVTATDIITVRQPSGRPVIVIVLLVNCRFPRLQGHPRLNLAFVANLFNKNPGLMLPSESDLSALKSQNTELFEAIARMQNERSEFDARLKGLAEENSRLNSSLQRLTELMTSSAAGSKEHEDDLRRLREENRALQQRNDALTERLLESQSRLTSKIEELTALQSATKGVDNAVVSDLRKQLADYEEYCTQAQGDLETERTRCSILESALAEANANVAASKQQLDDMVVSHAMDVQQTVDRLVRARKEVGVCV